MELPPPVPPSETRGAEQLQNSGIARWAHPLLATIQKKVTNLSEPVVVVVVVVVAVGVAVVVLLVVLVVALVVLVLFRRFRLLRLLAVLVVHGLWVCGLVGLFVCLFVCVCV